MNWPAFQGEDLDGRTVTPDVLRARTPLWIVLLRGLA